MVVSLRDNLKITDTSDNFVSEFNANFEKAYNYTIENVKPYKCEVEYLQSTGTQYINTKIKPSVNNIFDIIFSLTDVGGANNPPTIFGSRTSSLADLYALQYTNNKFRWAFGNKYPDYEDFVLNNEYTLNIQTTDSQLIVSGDIDYTSNNGGTYNTNDVYLFAMNNSGSVSQCAKVKIYKFKVTNNNQVIGDFIPVLDLNDVPCMYDKVTKEFFYNLGTGDFLYGDEVPDENISMYDVLNAFAVYNNLYYSGAPANSTFEWFLPDGVTEDDNVKAIKGSLVPYRLTFNDDTQHINFLRVEKNTVIDCSNLEPNTVRLTINPTPADATVTLTVDGYNQFNFTQVGNYIDVISGTTVSYTVSKESYDSKSGTILVNETTTQTISLDEITYTYTINPTPADATVIINGEERNSINVISGTTVSWEVSKTKYITRSGSVVVTEDKTDNIVLTEIVTLTINPTPNDATVTLAAAGYAQSGNTITVPAGTTVIWMVEKSGYVTQNGSESVSSNIILPITLVQSGHELDITDYEYTNINRNLVLTKYIGNDTNVIMPEVEE